MCGSSGGGVSTQQFSPPDYTQSATNPFWGDFVAAGAGLSQMPYQQYQGMTVSPLNDIQQTGLQFTVDRALNGAPDLNAARGQAMSTAQGGYLNTNPYSSNQYTDRVIASNAADMANAFRVGTAAQNDAMANLSGAYGGSAWAQKQAMDASGMAKAVGNMADQTRMNQTNLASGNWEAERGRMLQGAGLSGQLAQDDWTAARNLTGAGDGYSAYTQQLLDAQRGEFQQQQDFPWQQMDRFGNILSRASGSGNSTSLTQSGQGINPLVTALGLGAGGYSAYKFLGG